MIQDYIIFGAICAFTSSVVPIIRSGITLPLATTAIMTFGSLLLAGVYVSMSLWLSTSIEVVSFGLWMVLLLRHRPDRIRACLQVKSF